jgi:hypothetical protein
MSNNTSMFSNFSSSAPESRQLKEGVWTVILLSIAETNSFLNSDGSEKEDLPEWSDSMPQALYKLYCPEEKAFHTGRFQHHGVKEFDALTEKELKSGKFECAGKYAINSKTRERIVDEEKTAKCQSILNEFFHALQMPEGSSFENLADAIANKTLFTVKIVNKPYHDEDQLRVQGFKQYKAVTATSDFE